MSSDLVTDQDFYFALGCVTYSSARLQEEIEALMLGMVDGDAGTVVLVSDLSFSQLTQAAHALADRLIRGEKELATLASILKECTRFYELRNGMVHGTWCQTGDDSYRCERWRARGLLREHQVEYTIDEIMSVAHGLDHCVAQLEAFWRRKRFQERTMFDDDAGIRRMNRRHREARRRNAQHTKTRP